MWTIDATRALFNLWLKVRDRPFTAEDFRGYVQSHNFPEPSDPRAYGRLFVEAFARGEIVKLGFVKAKKKHAHQRPVCLWSKPKRRWFWRKK